MSALAGARAERAALRDRPAPAGTLDLSLGVFGFARDSRVLNVKAAGVPVVCSHDLGSSHHDRRHFIDKDFLLSLPDGAHLLEAARATEPSPACRAVICLADADVVALGDAPDAHPSSAASLRVLGMLPVEKVRGTIPAVLWNLGLALDRVGLISFCDFPKRITSLIYQRGICGIAYNIV